MVRDGESALLAPTGDAAALAERIAAVWRDPDAARLRARVAYREVAKYSWPAVSAQWAGIYRPSLLDSDNARAHKTIPLIADPHGPPASAGERRRGRRRGIAALQCWPFAATYSCHESQ